MPSDPHGSTTYLRVSNSLRVMYTSSLPMLPEPAKLDASSDVTTLTCIFPSLRTQQVEGRSTQLIEVGRSNCWKIRNGDQSVSGRQGLGSPYDQTPISETTVQKLSRFRNYGSETTSQKLCFRNYITFLLSKISPLLATTLMQILHSFYQKFPPPWKLMPSMAQLLRCEINIHSINFFLPPSWQLVLLMTQMQTCIPLIKISPPPWQLMLFMNRSFSSPLLPTNDFHNLDANDTLVLSQFPPLLATNAFRDSDANITFP